MSAWRRAGIVGLAAGAGAVPLLLANKIRGPEVPSVVTEGPREPSYWTLTAPEVPSAPRLEGDIHADVAVIGAGFAGLALAYYVKTLAPDRRVVLLESHHAGSGASSRNSGAVVPRLRRDRRAPNVTRAYDLLKNFIATEQIECDLQEDWPTLRLARHARELPEADLSGPVLAEQIGSSYYAAAATTTTNSVHPGKLIYGLVQANERCGVERYDLSPVTKIDRAGSLVLHTPHGRVFARDAALTTNAYTPQLGVTADIMTAMHQHVIVTRPLTDAEWEMSGLARWPMRFEVGDHYTHTVRRTPDRRFFFRHAIGHRAFENTTRPDPNHALTLGITEMVRRYPWLDGVPIDYVWHGVIGQTRSWWPVAGQIDDHLYIAAGYNGSGVIAAHYFGYVVAHQIVGCPLSSEDQAMLRPLSTHPRMPREYLRHILFQGWFRYQALRDR